MDIFKDRAKINSVRSGKNNFLKTFFWGAVLAGTVVFVFAVFFVLGLAGNLPSIEQIKNRQISESTKIYDRTGTILLYEINAGQKRTVVPFDEIPQFLKDATISIEDEKFYEERAFDWRGILRAVIANVTSGRYAQGGSTITQQLAKNAFLTREKTVVRKLKEFILAVQLDRNYSKNEILSYYLNEIPYGPMAYGAESASQTFFNKPVRDITLAEAAILAALPQSPTYYSPWGTHVADLIKRQRAILKKMYDTDKIDKKQMDVALMEKIFFAPKNTQSIKAPHFVFMVQDYLASRYGEDLTKTGGLKVITTLDWNLQQLAEKAVLDGAENNTKLYEGYNAALVAQDAKTGQILALVGSKDYFASSSLPANCAPGQNCKFEPNFNVAVQGLRQPGSALKPFVYLTAFEKGYAPETVLFDVPTEFTSMNSDCPPIVDFKNENEECFHPENFDEEFRGPIPLRQALAQSVNIPAVKTLYLAGLSDTIANVNKFGLTSLNDPGRYGLSLVLGGGEIKLIDLVETYSVLSQEGIKHRQALVISIENKDGEILEVYQDQNEQTVDPQYPRLINDILSDSEARAPLFQNSLGLTVFPDHEVALKTGTSNDYRDAWALGYTPSLVVGVWAGNNDNTPMQRHGSSILAAIPIWHAFLDEALKNQPAETFNRPDLRLPEKPILAGSYAPEAQIHTILQHVDRKNPSGPTPANPADDPQFYNWEIGVLDWAKNNSSTLQFITPIASSTPAVVAETSAPEILTPQPQITILSPQSDSVIQSRINLAAQIIAPSSLVNIEIYFNDQLVEKINGNFGKNYQLNWVVIPRNINPENALEVRATDQSGASDKAVVFLYVRN